MTVAELSNRLGAGELEKWLKYYEQEPFGQMRDNWHAAQLACIYINSNRPRNSQAATIDDFLYRSEHERGKMKIQKLMSGMNALAAKTNKKKE